jgi:glycosyltransferase involved in cell wall biosynthesis
MQESSTSNPPVTPEPRSVTARTAESVRPPRISLVIPLFNEQDSLSSLHVQLTQAMAGVSDDYEILYIDDGSTDRSSAILEDIHRDDPHVSVIQLRRNFGKSAAINAGFKEATGDLIFTLDADLQDDPAEIPRFLEKVAEGYDVVSGWKKTRHDPLSRRIASLVYNRTVAFFTGVRLHDINCGFKCYRSEVIREIEVYGELHRFIPPLAQARGFLIGEIPVRHHPRKHGKSRFGAERLLSGFFDFLTTILITRYFKKPLHFFGAVGLALFFSGVWINGYLTLWWVAGEPLRNRPLLLLGILLMILGVQITLTGLLADMIAFATKREQEYSVRRVLRPGTGDPR